VGGQRGAPQTQDPNARTYNNLPEEAKAQCNKDVTRGLVKSKEEYAKLYFEDEV